MTPSEPMSNDDPQITVTEPGWYKVKFGDLPPTEASPVFRVPPSECEHKPGAYAVSNVLEVTQMDRGPGGSRTRKVASNVPCANCGTSLDLRLDVYWAPREEPS